MSLLIYLRGIILNAHYTFYVNSQFSISCISFFICPLKSLPVCVASIFKNARQDSRNLTKTNLYKPALLPFHFVSPDWRSNIWKNKTNNKLNHLQLSRVIIRNTIEVMRKIDAYVKFNWSLMRIWINLAHWKQ